MTLISGSIPEGHEMTESPPQSDTCPSVNPMSPKFTCEKPIGHEGVRADIHGWIKWDDLQPAVQKYKAAYPIAKCCSRWDIVNICDCKVRWLLAETLAALIEADNHIRLHLQQQFSALAQGAPVDDPCGLGQSAAMERFATWWHGVGTAETIEKAKAATHVW